MQDKATQAMSALQMDENEQWHGIVSSHVLQWHLCIESSFAQINESQKLARACIEEDWSATADCLAFKFCVLEEDAQRAGHLVYFDRVLNQTRAFFVLQRSEIVGRQTLALDEARIFIVFESKRAAFILNLRVMFSNAVTLLGMNWQKNGEGLNEQQRVCLGRLQWVASTHPLSAFETDWMSRVQSRVLQGCGSLLQPCVASFFRNSHGRNLCARWLFEAGGCNKAGCSAIHLK